MSFEVAEVSEIKQMEELYEEFSSELDKLNRSFAFELFI